MFSDFNWSDLLPFIAALAVVLTVVVALYGLRQGHYSRGKLTRRGKRAVAAIILLGLVSLVSGIADRYVSAAKEKADARERTRQFERQMASLQRVTGDLGTVRGSLHDSLRRQEQLYGVASQNVRMSAAIQAQEQANTLSVLRRVFAESNRVSAERIAITVSYECPRPDRWRGSPVIGGAMLILNEGSRHEVRLLTEQHLALNGGLVFHGFMGDLGPYETFPAWRPAHITIRLFAADPGLDGRSLSGLPISEFNRMTDEERRLWAEPPAPQFCPTSATLLLNGRQVLSSRSTLRPDSAGDYRADFVNLRVDQRRLPRFAE